jgi:hypothetical protein
LVERFSFAQRAFSSPGQLIIGWPVSNIVTSV